MTVVTLDYPPYRPLHLTQIEARDRAIGALEARATEQLATFRCAAERLCTIPGVSAVTAQVILAEIRADLTPFPTAGHLISWAGLCRRLD